MTEQRFEGTRRDFLMAAGLAACGLPGCRPFAEALVVGESLPGKCTVSNDQGRAAIASFLGVAVGHQAKVVARLACAGGSNVARARALVAVSGWVPGSVLLFHKVEPPGDAGVGVTFVDVRVDIGNPRDPAGLGEGAADAFVRGALEPGRGEHVAVVTLDLILGPAYLLGFHLLGVPADPRLGSRHRLLLGERQSGYSWNWMSRTVMLSSPPLSLASSTRSWASLSRSSPPLAADLVRPARPSVT